MSNRAEAMDDGIEGPVVVDVEALRLADALLTLEVGGTPDLSRAEDPELSALLDTVALLRAGAHDVTETASYRSYHARSRAYILHTLEQRAAGVPESAAATSSREHAQSSGGIFRHIDPFLLRHRRLTLATPIAAAAAAAAIFFFGTPATAPTEGEPRAAIASNQTASTADMELARIQFTLATIANRSAAGQKVDATLLRTVTETTSAVANRIETAPASMSREHIENYQRTVDTGQLVLGSAQPAAGSEMVLAAALAATQDGRVTAARYLSAAETSATAVAGSKTPTPAAATSATPTATPAASVTPAAIPTATPTASGTPAATPAATSTPSASTPTASPSTPTPQADGPISTGTLKP